jgi:hypothetical protein
MDAAKAVRINEWKKLEYHDPADTLRRLREIEIADEISDLPAHVRALRTNNLKRFRESRETALFCFGMGNTVLGRTVWYSPFEQDDFDSIAKWLDEDGTEQYTPIQIKEMLPKADDPIHELRRLFHHLERYSDSNDLTVAIHVNAEFRLELNQLGPLRLPIGALWLFGATSYDQSTWFLCGNLLAGPKLSSFTYPEPSTLPAC